MLTPKCNAYGESIVRSVAEKRLNRSVGSVNGTSGRFAAHYHREGNHRGIGNELIVSTSPFVRSGRVRRRPRIGGMLNYYYRAA